MNIHTHIKLVVSHKLKICIYRFSIFHFARYVHAVQLDTVTVFDLIALSQFCHNNIYTVVFLLLGDFPASEFDMPIIFFYFIRI